MFIPKIDHISFRVREGKIALAVSFFSMLGWELVNNRNPKWESGQARFMIHPDGPENTYVQLTEETLEVAGVGSAFHLAFPVPDPSELQSRMFAWCVGHSVGYEKEDVGDGKTMVLISDVFYGAFEIIPL